MAYQGGNMKGISTNGVKIYSVTGNRSVATWLHPKKLRALRKDNDYQKRVELVQDLRFETATSRIKATSDGEYLIASGIYPPQVKVYELKELSLKFERHLISEIVDFEILSDDYSKLAFLCADRSVNFHAKYGSRYSLRIPRMGRDLAYDSCSCDLLCAASSPDLYRINLEQGRFLSSISTHSPALNVVTRSKLHGLVATGGEDGAVECFDMRVRSSVGRVDVVDEEITAIQLNESCGHQMAVGSSAGKVFLYDLRASSRPIRTKDHMFGSPIVDIKWHQTLNYEHPKLITADKHIVRIWDPDTGEDMTSIEPTAGRINDVCAFNGSGLVLLGLDCSQIPSYFIPTLGLPPKWCSYLEKLTEELEETTEATIYDNFKFVTKEELDQLNSTNLIGTDYLRAYMHGFFMDYRLYKKAKDIANPFNREAYLEQKRQEKIEASTRSSITIKRKLPKVNKAFFARLHENDESLEEKKDVDDTTDVKKSSKRRKGLNSDMIKDERFASIFENKDFEIDELSQEYMALHPMGTTKQKPSSSSLVEEHFEPIMEEDENQTSSEDNDDVDNGDGSKKKSRHPRLYEVKDERHAEAFYNRVSLSKEDALPMEERLAALNRGQQNGKHNADDVKIGAGGSREISFVSRSSARYKEDDDDDMDERRQKRGVKSLGLKSENLPYGGGGGGRGHRGGRGRGRGGGGGGGGRGFGGGGGRGGRGRGGGGGRGRGRGRR